MKEIVYIEKIVFEEILSSFETLTKQVELLYQQQKNEKLGERLDGVNMCCILNIRTRTLQTYRNTGKIGFTQNECRIFYRVEDLVQLLKESNISKNKNKKNVIMEIPNREDQNIIRIDQDDIW